MAERALHWFRNDLRLADNPALAALAIGTFVYRKYNHEFLYYV